MLTITVIGIPAPQGSKSFKGLTKSGRGIMVESSKLVKPWRQAVTYAAIEAMLQPGHSSDRPMLCGPVRVDIEFVLPKPKSAPKTRWTAPDKKPDLDKLCRSTFDALVDAGVIEVMTLGLFHCGRGRCIRAPEEFSTCQAQSCGLGSSRKAGCDDIFHLVQLLRLRSQESPR